MTAREFKDSNKKIKERLAECDLTSICNRLHRVKGQIGAVERMLVERRDFLEILQQLVAAREALDKIAVLILESEARGCLKSPVKKASSDLNRIVRALFKTI